MPRVRVNMDDQTIQFADGDPGGIGASLAPALAAWGQMPRDMMQMRMQQEQLERQRGLEDQSLRMQGEDRTRAHQLQAVQLADPLSDDYEQVAANVGDPSLRMAAQSRRTGAQNEDFNKRFGNTFRNMTPGMSSQGRGVASAGKRDRVKPDRAALKLAMDDMEANPEMQSYSDVAGLKEPRKDYADRKLAQNKALFKRFGHVPEYEEDLVALGMERGALKEQQLMHGGLASDETDGGSTASAASYSKTDLAELQAMIDHAAALRMLGPGAIERIRGLLGQGVPAAAITEQLQTEVGSGGETPAALPVAEPAEASAPPTHAWAMQPDPTINQIAPVDMRMPDPTTALSAVEGLPEGGGPMHGGSDAARLLVGGGAFPVDRAASVRPNMRANPGQLASTPGGRVTSEVGKLTSDLQRLETHPNQKVGGIAKAIRAKIQDAQIRIDNSLINGDRIDLAAAKQELQINLGRMRELQTLVPTTGSAQGQ